jgi:hypothetical protein
MPAVNNLDGLLPDSFGTEGFNEDGRRFNADHSGERYSLVREVREASSPIVTTTPVDETEREEPSQPAKQTMEGPFSTVRSTLVLHWIREQSWKANAVPRYLSQTRSSDPSARTMQQKWDDFQLFNYLPPSLTPTQQEFEDRSEPQKREAILMAAEANMAMSSVSHYQVDIGSAPVITQNEVTTPQPLLPEVKPFAENLLDECVQRLREQGAR